MRDVGWDNLGKQRGSAQGCGIVVFAGPSPPGPFLSILFARAKYLVACSILRNFRDLIFFSCSCILAPRRLDGSSMFATLGVYVRVCMDMYPAGYRGRS